MLNMDDFTLSGIPVVPIDTGALYHIEYTEFVESIAELSMLLEPLMEAEIFTEAKVSHGNTSLRRTKELTSEALGAYDNVTTGIGDVMHGGMKITLKLASLSTKVIKFICKMISAVPLAMTRMITDIGEITSRSLMTLSGDMPIYLTDNSLGLFEKEVKQEISHFIAICDIFTSGDNWITGLFSEDFKRYNQMKKIHLKLNAMRYEPTKVRVDTDHARAIYFNTESVYYARMTALNTFFLSKKPELEKLGKVLEHKITDTENSGNFYKLSAVQRMKAQDAVQMISSFMNIVGKYFRYVQEDLLVIQAKIDSTKSNESKNPGNKKQKSKPSKTDGT